MAGAGGCSEPGEGASLAEALPNRLSSLGREAGEGLSGAAWGFSAAAGVSFGSPPKSASSSGRDWAAAGREVSAVARAAAVANVRGLIGSYSRATPW